MKKTVVIYQSTYGATKQYAYWISQALKVECFELKSIQSSLLVGYELVIFGGSIHAGSLSGLDHLLKAKPKRLLVFTVGLAEPSEVDFQPLVERAFSKASLQPEKIFHFRGGIDYTRLKFVHRGLFVLLKKAVEKKPKMEQTAEEKAIIETYGKTIDFSQKEAINPLIDYIKENY
jgi:menaquinone-dependent protoporphyrinogen IX oxidase